MNISFAFKELMSRNIFFLDGDSSFLWDSSKKTIIRDYPESEEIIKLSNYPTSQPLAPLSAGQGIPKSDPEPSKIKMYQVDEIYELSNNRTIETFLETYKDCNIVLCLYYGSIYWGKQPENCPHCNQKMPEKPLFLRFWVDPNSKRRAKINSIKKTINNYESY